jgi:hypothetical protein
VYVDENKSAGMDRAALEQELKRDIAGVNRTLRCTSRYTISI